MGAAVAVVVALGVRSVIPAEAGADAPVEGIHQPPLFDATAPVPAHPGQSSLEVAVPTVAIIRVDEDGDVVSAMTNAGRAPLPSDETWMMYADGSMSAAPASIAAREWTGDFSEPGIYVPQSDG